MFGKFLQSQMASKDAGRHLENASAAQLAKMDGCDGVPRLVDHHLDRIVVREWSLSEFSQIIADSPALNNWKEE